MTRVFDDDLESGFGTRAIHAGQRPEPLSGAIMTPLYLTSTYVQDALGKNKGYEYARGKNPTREAFERNVAALEGGRHGFAFASGSASAALGGAVPSNSVPPCSRTWSAGTGAPPPPAAVPVDVAPPPPPPDGSSSSPPQPTSRAPARPLSPIPAPRIAARRLHRRRPQYVPSGIRPLPSREIRPRVASRTVAC